jgi:NADH:ubiquinone oxidoreductase subunit 5 (subunit L)/multisubunit Na+/H+ antiporter MnhA subunit
MHSQMGRLLKAGHSVDVRHLQQLAQRRRWTFVIAIAGAASLTLGTLMGVWGMENIDSAIAERSEAEPGVLQLAYRK